jgi:hypothetical protein
VFGEKRKMRKSPWSPPSRVIAVIGNSPAGAEKIKSILPLIHADKRCSKALLTNLACGHQRKSAAICFLETNQKISDTFRTPLLYI